MNPTAAVIVAGEQSILGTVKGVVTGILSPVLGGVANLALSTIVGAVLDAARAALVETAHVIGVTTAPQLTSAWFSATYWRVAALAALLTVPFLCAAALQAVLHSDIALLGQAALVHLPLALVGVGLAAPVVMLLLAATDQMCAAVSGAGIGGGANFLVQAAAAAGVTSRLGGSPFLALIVGLFTAAAALALMLELLVREAAVYIVVLMLPLVFAALVWPARRVWAVRLIELLLALILSKFAIVAVLSLAGAAYGATGVPHVSELLTAMALVLLSTFAPWAMLRLLPFAEVAASAAETISGRAHRVVDPTRLADQPGRLLDVVARLATMRTEAGEAGQDDGRAPDLTGDGTPGSPTLSGGALSAPVAPAGEVTAARTRMPDAPAGDSAPGPAHGWDGPDFTWTLDDRVAAWQPRSGGADTPDSSPPTDPRES